MHFHRRAADRAAIRPFHINFPESELTDCASVLTRRAGPTGKRSQCHAGVQLATTQALAAYWANEYDWRKIEAKLNSLPNFITEIDGLDIHFIMCAPNTRTHCLSSSLTGGPVRSSSS